MSYHYAAFPPAYTPEPVYTYEYYEYPSAQWAVPDGTHAWLGPSALPVWGSNKMQTGKSRGV